jgi:anti-anti-sigma regulatory factor
MLRITVQESNGAQTIKLEGKIAGPWVEEFNRTWLSISPSLGAKELQLDLRGVAFVDTKGRDLLRKIYRQTNARFLADSPWTRYFVHDAMRESSKNGEEGV